MCNYAASVDPGGHWSGLQAQGPKGASIVTKMSLTFLSLFTLVDCIEVPIYWILVGLHLDVNLFELIG